MNIIGLLKPSVLKICITIAVVFSIFLILFLFSGTHPFMVRMESASMLPAINMGDMLFIQAVNADELKIGDIIMYYPEREGGIQSTAILHRIVEINQDGSFQTQGDANPAQLYFEKRIEHDRIHGKVISSIPFIGYLPFFWWILILIIYLVSCVVFRNKQKIGNIQTKQ